jgi:hypothetical protein
LDKFLSIIVEVIVERFKSLGQKSLVLAVHFDCLVHFRKIQPTYVGLRLLLKLTIDEARSQEHLLGLGAKQARWLVEAPCHKRVVLILRFQPKSPKSVDVMHSIMATLVTASAKRAS